MLPNRRRLIKLLGLAGTYAALGLGSLLKPVLAWAAEWNKTGFEAKDTAAALAAIGATKATESNLISIKAPDISENGSAVNIAIASAIPGTSSLAVIVDKNPNPLAGHFSFSGGALPEVSLRLKFAATSTLRVVAVANGKYYIAQQDIKVAVGGCAG